MSGLVPRVQDLAGFLSHGHERGRDVGVCGHEGYFVALAWFVTFRVDVDRAELGAVEITFGLVIDRSVELVCFTRELEQDADVLLHEVAVDCCIPDESFGVGNLRAKLLLSRLQVFGLHNAVEIGINEALLLTLQCDESTLLDCNQLAAVIELQCNELVDRRFNECKFGFAVVLRTPEVVNRIFDFVLLEVRQVAVTPAGVPIEAEEVCVGAASSVGVTESHPSLAAVALHGALEEVVMLP